MAQPGYISPAREAFIGVLVVSEFSFPEISREAALTFTRNLLKTCNICTNPNIQLCNDFIVQNIWGCGPRVSALMKYLLSMSTSFGPRDLDKRMDTTRKFVEGNEGLGIVKGKVQQPPQPAFKRLHVLYILHNVLSYTQQHSIGLDYDTIDERRATASALARLAACKCNLKAAETSPQVLEVLAHWQSIELFYPEQIDHMRNKIKLAEYTEWESLLSRLAADEETRLEEERKRKEDLTKWYLPHQHGVINDPHSEWHELPAANGLLLKRTRGAPLRSKGLPKGGYEVFDGGHEADEELRAEVTSLYDNMIRCYDKYTNPDEVQDVDACGNIIWKDPDRPTRNYWGFTLDGIDKRKELAKGFAELTTGYADIEEAERLDAVERARSLAAARNADRGYGRGHAYDRRGNDRGYYRESDRWGGQGRRGGRGGYRGRR